MPEGSFGWKFEVLLVWVDFGTLWVIDSGKMWGFGVFWRCRIVGCLSSEPGFVL